MKRTSKDQETTVKQNGKRSRKIYLNWAKLHIPNQNYPMEITQNCPMEENETDWAPIKRTIRGSEEEAGISLLFRFPSPLPPHFPFLRLVFSLFLSPLPLSLALALIYQPFMRRKTEMRTKTERSNAGRLFRWIFKKIENEVFVLFRWYFSQGNTANFA